MNYNLQDIEYDTEAIFRNYQKGVLKGFAKFTGRHLCWFLCKTFKNSFFIEQP